MKKTTIDIIAEAVLGAISELEIAPEDKLEAMININTFLKEYEENIIKLRSLNKVKKLERRRYR